MPSSRATLQTSWSAGAGALDWRMCAALATDPVQTARLVLTPIGVNDIEELLLLYGDPLVASWDWTVGPERCRGLGWGHGGTMGR